MTEHWRPVPGYEGTYEVSDFGRVRSLTRVVRRNDGRTRTIAGRILRCPKDDGGRRGLKLHADGEYKHARVHRLVLEAFVGPCPDGMEGCHNDGDHSNNRLDNLRWDTRSENMLDQVRHGTHIEARKTHCTEGHPLSGENLDAYVTSKGKRQRRCRTCHRTRQLARYHAKRRAVGIAA